MILTGTAGHFCSGLDLSEHVARDAEGTMRHSRNWHRVMDLIELSGLPVVSAMFGAVIGGGLELAASSHVRIAEPSCIFQLPEGRRGIFVGGGATGRIGRILGPDRMCEMMLTGRKFGTEEGLAMGLTHYAVGEGEALAKARELAQGIATPALISRACAAEVTLRLHHFLPPVAPMHSRFFEVWAAELAEASGGAIEVQIFPDATWRQAATTGGSGPKRHL